jgi:hypothetical protein
MGAFIKEVFGLVEGTVVQTVENAIADAVSPAPQGVDKILAERGIVAVSAPAPAPTPAPAAVPATAALKHDSAKVDLSLVPLEAMEGIARAMTYGAKKYSRGNYRLSGMEWTRLAAACARHLFAWLAGEDLDPESGLSHIDHAQASLAMLAFQMKSHPEKDNRK